MKDFFISYNKADREFAEWVAWQLEDNGYSVVIQAWDFKPGDNFVLEMHQALEQAQRTLILLSPDFLASKFTAPEWAAAFAQDPDGSKGTLVPVRIRKCKLTGLLSQINYIDLVGCKDRKSAKKILLKGVSQLRAKPDSEPGFPSQPGDETTTASETNRAPEPEWPPAITIATRFASRLVWRILRIGAVILITALIATRYFAFSLPHWYTNNTNWAISASVILGFLTMIGFESLMRLFRHIKMKKTAIEDN